MKTGLIAAFAWVTTVGTALHAATNGFYRFAAAAPEHVVFTAEGDLWRVGLAGGSATRLTTHLGLESRAAVSPDGKTVAFSASLEGPTEVYVMPLAGGDTRRLTFEGETALVMGWTPSGEVLYSTARFSGLPARQLATIHPTSFKKLVLPAAKASEGVVDADGQLFFTRNRLRGDNARRYKGGGMPQIWSITPGGRAEAVALTRDAQGNNSAPMVWAGKVYFVSDRSGARNLWRMERDGSSPKQLTHLKPHDFDLRHAHLHSGRIAYTVGADVRVFDINANADRAVNINLSSDFEQRRERWTATALRNMTSVALAPNGERVAVTARGKVVVAAVGDLRRVELSLPQESRSRAAQFSADSASVFLFNDATGEQELVRHSASGGVVAVPLTNNGRSVRLGIYPSPDGKWVLHNDHDNRLYVTRLATTSTAATTEMIDEAPSSHASIAWAPDASAFTFARPLRTRNANDVLFMVRLSDKKRQQLTTERYSARSPAFTPDGKWLFFLSDRHLVATPGSPWGSRNMGSMFDKRDRIYALALQSDLRWPYAARDELSIAAAPAPSPQASAASASASKLPAISFDGIDRRLYEVAASLVPAGNLRQLQTDGKRLYFIATEQPGSPRGSLRSVAIDSAALPAEVHSADVTQYQISGNGRKILVVKQADGPTASPEMSIFDVGPKPPASPQELARSAVRLADWSVKLSPALEWQQIFNDAWRMHRDYFYDPAMHGVDWVAMRKKYEPLLSRLTDRLELADLLAQMVGEVNALHSQVGAGDTRSGLEQISVGSLGAVLSPHPQGHRIDKIYQTEHELALERGPLALPGVDVRVGDVITAINNQTTVGLPDVSDLLRGQAGKQVLMGVLRGTQTLTKIITPSPVARERDLRLSDWEQSRREAVEAASDAKMGYLHLRAMGGADLATFAREFYPLFDREGLIIDVRGNGGGSIDSVIIEKLLRRAWAFWQARAGGGNWNMQNAFRGHLVVLTDEDTYSDGETFSEGIKRLGLGTVIGKRTSGAGVWLTDRNRQSDGGISRAAEFAQYAADGTWLVEGTGVSPDIEVDNPPRATFNGEDNQLQAAIAHLKKAMSDKPVPQVKQPPMRKM